MPKKAAPTTVARPMSRYAAKVRARELGERPFFEFKDQPRDHPDLVPESASPAAEPALGAVRLTSLMQATVTGIFAARGYLFLETGDKERVWMRLSVLQSFCREKFVQRGTVLECEVYSNAHGLCAKRVVRCISE